MRLFRGKIPIIAAEITQTLIKQQDIESEDSSEVEKDIEAVLKEYLRAELDLVERAKDRLEAQGLPYSKFGKVKKTMAEKQGFGVGEDAPDYIMAQIIGVFMHSIHVDEVYSEDHDLRRKMGPILKKHMAVDEEVDLEVRNKIKNLEEGSMSWEAEYERVKQQILRKRRLSE
jgi:hypothetical protein